MVLALACNTLLWVPTPRGFRGVGENAASHFILDCLFLIWEHVFYKNTAFDHPFRPPFENREGWGTLILVHQRKAKTNMKKDGPPANDLFVETVGISSIQS